MAEAEVASTRSRCGSSTSIDGEIVKTRARGESYDTVGILRNDSRPLPQERDIPTLGTIDSLEASFDSLLKDSGLSHLSEGQPMFSNLSEYRQERSASWEGAPLVRVDRSGSIESCCSSNAGSNSGWSSSGWSSSSDAEAGTSRPKSKVAWTPEEDQLIAEGVRRFGNKWSRIVELLPTAADRTDDAVRNRWQRLQRKQKRQEAKAARGGRALSGDFGEDGLAPSKHGDMWTKEEDNTIDDGVKRYGFKWRVIASQLPGRTESGCRNRWIRNQERVLDARGIRARGAQEVIAALHKSGELRQNGSDSGACPAPVYYHAPARAADAMDDEPLFPPPPDEPLFPPAAAYTAAAYPAEALPAGAGAVHAVSAACLSPASSYPAASYPWETSAAIQALRRDSSASIAQPEVILGGLGGP